MRVRGLASAVMTEWPGLEEVGRANRQLLNQLYSAAYEELRRMASAVRQADPGATLSPTTLVNEAWLKLAGAAQLEWESPLHFKRIAARAMRQVVLEAARKRSAAKRGAGELRMVTFDEELPAAGEEACGAEELLRLEAALEKLAAMSPRQAAIVESRFFGGLEVAETAEVLGVSEATVARDWRVARAWLGRELRKDR